MYNKLLEACQVVLILLGPLTLSGCGSAPATPTPVTGGVSQTAAPTPVATSAPTASPAPTATATPSTSGATGTVVTSIPKAGTAVPAATASTNAISIEVVGTSANHVFVAPGQTATIPFQTNPSVLVHYPYLIGSTEAGGFRPYRVEITVDPPLWQVGVGNYPNGNTLSLHLWGDTPGRFTITVAMPEKNQTVSFTLEVLPPAGPTSTPSAMPRITLNDSGQTLQLQVGQRFLLDLGTGYDWTVTVADTAIVSRVVNVLVVEGAQGIYEAKQPGRTILTATGDPPCRKAQPPCGAPSRLFKIDIVIR